MRLVFHPESEGARELARAVHDALNADPVMPGLRFPTTFCPIDGTGPPAGLDLEQADRNFVAILADLDLAADAAWCTFVGDVWERCRHAPDQRCVPFALGAVEPAG